MKSTTLSLFSPLPWNLKSLTSLDEFMSHLSLVELGGGHDELIGDESERHGRCIFVVYWRMLPF